MATCLRHRANLLTEKFDDALIVVDVRAGQVHELNSTAAWLWDRLDGCKDIGELVKALCSCQDVTIERAKGDIKKLLEELFQLDLVSKE